MGIKLVKDVFDIKVIFFIILKYTSTLPHNIGKIHDV